MSKSANQAWRRYALVTQARTLDRAALSQGKTEHTETSRRRRDVYRRLAEEMGWDVDSLQRSSEARAAAAGWAVAAEDALMYDEAGNVYARLREAFPADANYLAGAARTWMQLEQWTDALECWRLLLRGLSNDDPLWFEAKYGQIVCLRRTGAPEAEPVWRQFQTLYPDLGPSPWKERFEELRSS